MADKYLYDNSGTITECEATVTSAGAGNAGDIVALDSGGLLDISTMPSGVGADTVVLACSEDVAAGDWLNVWNDSSVIKCRKADATTSGKPCHGFTLEAKTSGQNVTVYLSGTNNQMTSLTGGSTYYLATTAGAETATAPSASGNLVQKLGVATATTSISFKPERICVKA